MRSSGRIALRVALAFAIIAALWALEVGQLESSLQLSRVYDYALDLLFGLVSGAILYVVVSRELLARVIAQQAAVAEVWRAANDALEARVIERTDALQKANDLLQAEMLERTRAEQDLTRLLDLSHHMTSTLDLRQLLSLILEHVERMIGFTSASIWRCDGDRLVPLDYRGPLSREQALQAPRTAAECPIDREVLQEGRPVIIGDLQSDTQLARAYREAAGQRLLGSDLGSRSWMGVPLMIEDRILGMLRLDHMQPDYFTPHHAQLAMAIGNLAAVAIQNAMSYEDAQRVAVLNERARLARDLHDSIIQAVYAMTWNMRSAHEIMPSDAGRAGKLVEQALNTARTCLLDLRSLIFELRPELIEQYGLSGLLARHVESVQGGSLLDFSMEIAGEPELPLRTKEALYRIAQEALQNAMKHSQAQQVRLSLQQDLTQVFLAVEDNGVGFDPGTASPGQLGLHSMRERAAKVGGRLEILSGYGRGTQIQIQVPLQPARIAA